MDAARHQRISDLFLRAHELPASQRADFLAEECRGDSELRSDVESMLEHDRLASAVLPSEVPLALMRNADLAPPVPDQIGPYRIVRELGRGGMGIVYLGEQDAPIRRRVAVKLIKRGMDSERVIARFQSERQALALMEHPAIAKILDADTTADGRPYFAMEYVEGVPITEHCDCYQLTSEARLELFLQICEGVQHAHQKAVIHRDLKPSNVLVVPFGERAAVKIIDFGLAKALSQSLTEESLHTELGIVIGTPGYMSPEQLETTGANADTRSDVYSLGVILYELLVGLLPFEPAELRDATPEEIRRKIREESPARPSARLAAAGERGIEAARRRRTGVSALRRELNGDLDWITMRALEKECARRYGSPSELAEDIRRHLRSEPVLAHAPSTTYRARKFVRRHGLTVAAVTLTILGLAAGAVLGTIGTVRARRAEAEARREAVAKGQVSDFVKGLFQVWNPQTGATITARELLDNGAATIAKQLQDQPDVRAELQVVIGDIFRELGMYPRAETFLHEALGGAKSQLGAEHRNTLAMQNSLANVYLNEGRSADAEQSYSETLAIQKRVLGSNDPDTLNTVNNLAVLLLGRNRYAEAEALLKETIAVRKRVQRPEDPNTLKSMSNLADVFEAQGRYPEAEQLQTQVLEIRRRVLGPQHPDTLVSMNNLALIYLDQGRSAEARKLHESVLEMRTRVLGAEHPNTLESMTNLANVDMREGHYPEAEQRYSRALEMRKRVLGPEHPTTLATMNNLANAFLTQNRYPEAEALLSETFDLRARILGADNELTLGTLNNLAIVNWSTGNYRDAENRLSKVLEGRVRGLGAEHPTTIGAMVNLALVFEDEGRHAEAEQLFSKALEVQKRVLPPEHPDTLGTMYNLSRVYVSQGRHVDAEAIASQALDAQIRTLRPGHPDTIQSILQLATISTLLGNRAEALTWLSKSIDSGFQDFDALEQATEYRALHGPEFDALLATARSKAAASSRAAASPSSD